MNVHEEGFKNMRHMCCCGPWMRGSHSGFRLIIGSLLILIGSIWYATRMGWIDAEWFRAIPFWPIVVIIIGICLVYRGLNARRVIRSGKEKEV